MSILWPCCDKRFCSELCPLLVLGFLIRSHNLKVSWYQVPYLDIHCGIWNRSVTLSLLQQCNWPKYTIHWWMWMNLMWIGCAGADGWMEGGIGASLLFFCCFILGLVGVFVAPNINWTRIWNIRNQTKNCTKDNWSVTMTPVMPWTGADSWTTSVCVQIFRNDLSSAVLHEESHDDVLLTFQLMLCELCGQVIEETQWVEEHFAYSRLVEVLKINQFIVFNMLYVLDWNPRRQLLDWGLDWLTFNPLSVLVTGSELLFFGPDYEQPCPNSMRLEISIWAF